MTKVIYYTTSEGENPVYNFLNLLTKKQQRKLLRIIDHIKTYGLESVIPHLKKLTGTPLWEIRVLGRDNIRVLYASYFTKTMLFFCTDLLKRFRKLLPAKLIWRLIVLVILLAG